MNVGSSISKAATEVYLRRYPDTLKFAIDTGVCYPSGYRTGMSNLALHFLYDRLRRRPELRVERVFLDTAPHTFESGVHVSELKVLFFTISYEEDYFNLVKMLRLSGIEPLREKRALKQIIVAGGPAVTANPAPISPIADAVVMGEGEVTIDRILDSLVEWGASPDFLEELSRMPHVFVPDIGGLEGKAVASGTLERFSSTVILTGNTTFANTLLIEIGRGCRSRCSFCLARGIYGKFKHASFEWIKSTLESLPPRSGVGLVSTAVLSHPRFNDILSFLAGRGCRVTVSSIRAEDLNFEKAGLLASSGLKSVSLAPESGSARVRSALGKKVSSERYIDAARILSEAGMKRLSLYMLVGFAHESPGDLPEITLFLHRIRKAASGMQITIHANVIIPKPATPFQFLPFSDDETIRRSIDMLKSAASGTGIGLRFKSMRSAMRQAILSMGDEGVGRAVVLNAAHGIAWKKALEIEGVDTGFIYRKKDLETRFPWDGVSGLESRERLYKRFLGLFS